MSQVPEVCVVMSTYNGEVYVVEQIRSILDQIGVQVSLYIRDDGSSDNTVEKIREYIKKSEGNIEVIEGRNIGIQKSFSQLLKYVLEMGFDYYAFADQDDIWKKDKLFVGINQLKKMNKGIPLLYFSNLSMIDNSRNALGNVYNKNKLYIKKSSALIRNYAYGCTCVFNKKAVQLYCYNIEVRMWMHDYWMYLVCMYLGEVYYDQNTYIYYRQHENNTVGYKHSLKRVIINKIKSLQKLKERPREAMAIDFLDTYNDFLLESDKIYILDFINYRKNLFSRIKASMNKDYLVNGRRKNIILKIRFLIGAV